MNGKQHTVMWLGIILIMARMWSTRQAQDIWAQIVAPEAKPSTGASGGSDPCAGLCCFALTVCRAAHQSAATTPTGNAPTVASGQNPAGIPT